MCDVSGKMGFGCYGFIGSTGTAGAEEQRVRASLVDERRLPSAKVTVCLGLRLREPAVAERK